MNYLLRVGAFDLYGCCCTVNFTCIEKLCDSVLRMEANQHPVWYASSLVPRPLPPEEHSSWGSGLGTRLGMQGICLCSPYTTQNIHKLNMNIHHWITWMQLWHFPVSHSQRWESWRPELLVARADLACAQIRPEPQQPDKRVTHEKLHISPCTGAHNEKERLTTGMPLV